MDTAPPEIPIPKASRWLSAVRVRLRKLSSRDSRLPDFLIIGAQKSGTSSLHWELNRHPHVFVARSKQGDNEVHFFDRDEHWDLGLDWYRTHFDQTDRLQGEKTPDLLARTACHERMKQVVPRARLIVSLRNPVDRAYSQWNHFNQIAERSAEWGWKVTDFEEALKLDPMILQRGHYLGQIEGLLRFYPRRRLHIIIAERLKSDTQLEMDRVHDFLGVARIPVGGKPIHSREYPGPMRAETRERLAGEYRESNERLFEFLGERIDEWD